MVARFVVPMGILCLLIAVIAVQLPGSTPEASAATEDKVITEAVTVINSDIAWNLKLMTFEKLRKKGGSDVVKALVKLTASKDQCVSTLACTTLARMGTDASKGELKTIIKNTKAAKTLRQAAMNTLARAGNLADRSWLESNVKNDVDLAGQFSVLEKMSFWK